MTRQMWKPVFHAAGYPRGRKQVLVQQEADFAGGSDSRDLDAEGITTSPPLQMHRSWRQSLTVPVSSLVCVTGLNSDNLPTHVEFIATFCPTFAPWSTSFTSKHKGYRWSA